MVSYVMNVEKILSYTSYYIFIRLLATSETRFIEVIEVILVLESKKGCS